MTLLSFVLFSLYFGISVQGVDGTDNGTYCTIDNTYSISTKYCDYGCCGSYYDNNRRCCDEPSETYVAVYVGGGIGGTFSMIIFLCVIYACCKSSDRVRVFNLT